VISFIKPLIFLLEPLQAARISSATAEMPATAVTNCYVILVEAVGDVDGVQIDSNYMSD